jgi:hypothetical protein
MAAALLTRSLLPVERDELLRSARRISLRKHPLRIEESTLDLGEYLAFLER